MSCHIRVESEIKKWGNSLAIRITRDMAKLPGFTAGLKVVVDSSEDGLVVKKAYKEKSKLNLPYTEKDLLKGITSYSAHADSLAEITANEIGHIQHSDS